LHAQSLHFPLTAPFHIAIFQTWSPHAPKESPTHDHVLRLLTDSNKPRSHMITAKLEPDRYILAFAGTREDNIRSTLEWLLQLAEDFYPVVGVSSPAKQISDIRTALTEAQLALDLRLPSVPFPSHVQPAKQ